MLMVRKSIGRVIPVFICAGPQMHSLGYEEAEKLRHLNRVKLLATLVLALCFCTLVVSKMLEQSYPAFAIVTAFSEAATIGGIADWYAVVALFKRPLNLPFPHTAIIPRNQKRIGDNLGRFIETNFLTQETLKKKLEEVDFSGEIALWLSGRSRSESLSRFVVRMLPQLLQSVDDRALMKFSTERVTGQIAQVDVAPLAGKILQALTTQGHHEKLLNDVITALHRFLHDEDTLRMVRQKIKDELPVLFNVLGADNVVLNRIIRSTTELLDEIKNDEHHPLRNEFEAFLVAYIKRVRRTKAFAQQVEQMKQLVLSRPELESVANNLWSEMRSFVEEDARSENSVLAARMTDLFVEIGLSLKKDTDLRRDIDAGMVLVLSNLISEQRSNIADYISEQVSGWDMGQLLTLIEINVGRDLQYIRFNGMIIGGFVGLCLFGIERLLLS